MPKQSTKPPEIRPRCPQCKATGQRRAEILVSTEDKTGKMKPYLTAQLLWCPQCKATHGVKEMSLNGLPSHS